MPVRFQDYYQTLGLARDASGDDVKRAYRKLARQHHPDVNKAADAAERFKQINEAYEVLKDPKKRALYDRLGANWRAGEEFTPPPGGPAGGYGRGFRGGGFGDAGGFSDFFEAFFGGERSDSGRGGRSRRGARRPVGPTSATLAVSVEDLVRGGKREFQLHDGGETRTISLKLPPLSAPGTVLRLAGQGEVDPFGGGRGDLWVELELSEHPRWRVQGDDLIARTAIAPHEAVLGATVDLRLVDGQASLRVPPGTQSGAKLRLRGQGLPKKGGGRGDLFAEIAIVVPRAPSPREVELYTELAKAAAPPAREGDRG